MSELNWTERYGEGHNQRRAARLAADPDYAEKVRKQKREWAQKNREKNADGWLRKTLEGTEHKVVRISGMAAKLGVTTGKLQADRKHGRLPDSRFEGRHNYYTAHQIDLYRKFLAHQMTRETMMAGWYSEF